MTQNLFMDHVSDKVTKRYTQCIYKLHTFAFKKSLKMLLRIWCLSVLSASQDNYCFNEYKHAHPVMDFFALS